MAAQYFLFFITIFSFLSFSTPLSTDSILTAADVLSLTGYNSMSLTLEFATPAILPIQSPSLTIFSPLDSAFTESGQPSLSLLRFHFSPLILSMHSLKSLPPGTKIPTLFPNHSIIVTSAATFSLNGVAINGSVVYDDGSLVIFGIDKFLDPNFQVFGSVNGRPLHSFGCPALPASSSNGTKSFEEAIRVLRFGGYSTMAWFLDLQLGEMKEHTRLTIFAPSDDDQVIKCSRAEYRSIFLRHFVPCRISKADLVKLDNGVVMPTYLKGFMLHMRKFGDVLLPNQVKIAYPDLYTNDWLVVHGLRGSFAAKVSSSSSSSSSSPSSSAASSLSVSFKNLNGTTTVDEIVILVAFLLMVF